MFFLQADAYSHKQVTTVNSQSYYNPHVQTVDDVIVASRQIKADM
jgi:hypothetical protein